MSQLLTITTYNGHNINDGTIYEARFLLDSEIAASPAFSSVLSDVLGGYPTHVREQPAGRTLPLYIRVKANTLVNVRQLKQWFDSQEGEVLLKATDSASTALRITVSCEQLIVYEETAGLFIARLYAAKPLWEADTPSTDTQVISSSPATWGINNAGNGRVNPVVTLSPTCIKPANAHYQFKWDVVIANRSDRALTDTLGGGYPVEINEGNISLVGEVSAGRLQSDKDDLRVLVDGEEVDRWIDGEKVWINLSLSPRRTAVLKTAMTAVDPASGGSVLVGLFRGEDTSGWDESGFFQIGSELCYYDSKVLSSFDGIIRACRGTTAATHDVGTTMYWVEKNIQILEGFSAATNPPSSDDLKPVINLTDSTNAYHFYDDVLVAWESKRSGQFLPTPSEDNRLSQEISINAGTAQVAWYDTKPPGYYPKYNNLEISIPCHLKAGSAIQHSMTVNRGLNVNLFGVDVYGNEHLIQEQQYYRYGFGAAACRGSFTPTEDLTRLRYNSRITTITGAYTDTPDNEPSGSLSIGSVTTRKAQKFAVDNPSNALYCSVMLKKEANSTGEVCFDLSPDDSGVPASTGAWLWPQTIGSASIGTAWSTFSLFAAPYYYSGADEYVSADAGGRLKKQIGYGLAPGNYWLHVYRDGVGTFYIGVTDDLQPTYSRGGMCEMTAGIWGEELVFKQNWWFTVNGDMNAQPQPEALTDLGGSATLRDIKLRFNTDYTPKISMGARGSAYWILGTLENTTTGQLLPVSYVSPLAGTLSIDCDAKTIIENIYNQSVAYAESAADIKDWLYHAAGSNTYKWTESSIGAGTPGTISVGMGWRDPYS